MKIAGFRNNGLTPRRLIPVAAKFHLKQTGIGWPSAILMVIISIIVRQPMYSAGELAKEIGRYGENLTIHEDGGKLCETCRIFHDDPCFYIYIKAYYEIPNRL